MSSLKSQRARRATRRMNKLLTREKQLWEQGRTRVAGVDEAGVGPLAGPVVAAAVILPSGGGIKGVDDSKKITPLRRARLAEEIRARAEAYSVSIVEPAEIDSINIYQACLTAMRRSVLGLAVRPQFVLVDARTIPGIEEEQEAVIKGDAHCHAIAAASILAKCARDDLMRDYDDQFPGYGFGDHKGYPTEAHRDAIRRLGPTPIHRRSFTLLPHPRLFD